MTPGKPIEESRHRNKIKFLPLLLIFIFAIYQSNYSYSILSSTLPISNDISANPDPKTNQQWNYQLDPLGIPPGEAENLPSVRVSDENVDAKRDPKRGVHYGGKGDKQHLGGFTLLDIEGITPNLWANLIKEYGVRSFLDVGCGKGVSTLWFLEHGADVLCVEGSHDGVSQSLLPADKVVEHDFSRGPWWPEKTYDIAWSVEFLEHVSRQYHFNYMSTFRKAALIFVTSSRWGGWHHVEIHPDEWWIRKIELYGFKYEPELTEQGRQWSQKILGNFKIAPNGQAYRGNHVNRSLKVFSNPRVAALPQHAHLFPRPGCFDRYADKESNPTFISVTKPCDNDTTKLPDSYEPLVLLPEMHERWNATVAASI